VGPRPDAALHDGVALGVDLDVDGFERDGLVRVPGAFSRAAAAAMCDVIWDDLARQYRFDRDDPRTWLHGSPAHLQHLKGRPEFDAIGGATTLHAIATLFGDVAWHPPRDWGAIFLSFPCIGHERDVPADPWHLDAFYGMPVRPLHAVKVFTLLADLLPANGGTMFVAGSHHVVERFGRRADPHVLAKNARARQALMRSDPWFEALRRPGDPAARVERFMERDGDIDGLRVRVVELHGEAGDLLLVHPSVLHCRPPHPGPTPRFMLSKDIPAAAV
jgi:hypothetical protein